MLRTIQRMRSPRRILATSLTIAFFALYIANGYLILSTRQPVEPERVRWWLSGGMVIYAIYHGVRCAWSRRTPDLEFTAAEDLWLGGAPMHRSSLAIYHVGGMVLSAALKTMLLAVVLALDVSHLELLCVGVFASLLLLEIFRLMIGQWVSTIDEPTRFKFRIVMTLMAALIGFQIVARVMAMTPTGSPTAMYLLGVFDALGQTAASEAVQWMSLPWIASAQVAVTERYGWTTLIQLASSLSVLPLAVWGLVLLDARSERLKHVGERLRLRERDKLVASNSADASVHYPIAEALPNRCGRSECASLIARQCVSVKRYRGTIVFSFLVPTLLCLSPLATGQIKDQWLFVVGGIALCTMLLAPPALRIDFRRDLKRILLLRSLPVRPIAMVMGQIAIPVLITSLFQLTTIAIAAAVTRPGWPAVALWTGMLSALSLITFATENALFLAFPHHERAEGVAMMIRVKLTFLAKAAGIMVALGLLVVWATFCRNHLPTSIAMTVQVTGAVAAAWTLAILATQATTWCWQRFDISHDVPPQ